MGVLNDYFNTGYQSLLTNCASEVIKAGDRIEIDQKLFTSLERKVSIFFEVSFLFLQCYIEVVNIKQRMSMFWGREFNLGRFSVRS